MDIPITISLKGNHPELYRDLFGLGEEVKDPEVLKILGPGARYTNKNAEITNGAILSEKKERKYFVAESLEAQLLDYNFILTISSAIGLGELSFKVTNWILDKIGNYDYKIKIGKKEIKNKDDFQKTLEDFFKENS